MKQVRSLGISSPPGRKIYELYIAVESRPMILAKIATLMGERSVDILAGHLQSSDDERTGYDIFYLEMADAIVTPDELLKLLKGQDFVRDAQLEPKGQVKFETMMFPLTSAGHTRLFVLSAEGWAALVNSILKTFGTAGSVILHNQGVSVGQEMVDKVKTMFAAPITEDLLVENFRAYFGAGGFGILDISAVDRAKRITINQPVTFGGDGQLDQFLVGVVRGAVSRIYSADLVVQDLKYSNPEVRFDLVPGTSTKDQK